MDMTATVADHEFDPYDSGGEACGHVRNVQINHHAAGTVGIDLVGTGFLPSRRKVVAGEIVALVITLREVTLAVEHLDAGHNLRRNILRRRWRVVSNAEGV